MVSVLVACAFAPLGLVSAESTASDITKSSDGDAVQMALHQRRMDIAQSLKAAMEKAKTPQEKIQVIEKYREEMKALEPQRLPESDSRTALERIVELKAKAAGSPEAQARYTALESRLKLVETMRMKMEKLSEASPEPRAAILEEVQRDRESLLKTTRQEIKARPQEKQETVDLRTLPPEMQAVQAKAEERRREVAELKEALDKATPEQRVALLRDWQQKRLADRPVVEPAVSPATR